MFGAVSERVFLAWACLALRRAERDNDLVTVGAIAAVIEERLTRVPPDPPPPPGPPNPPYIPLRPREYGGWTDG